MDWHPGVGLLQTVGPTTSEVSADWISPLASQESRYASCRSTVMTMHAIKTQRAVCLLIYGAAWNTHLEVLGLHQILPDPRCISTACKQDLHGTAGRGSYTSQVGAAAGCVGHALVLTAQCDKSVDWWELVCATLNDSLRPGSRVRRIRRRSCEETECCLAACCLCM